MSEPSLDALFSDEPLETTGDVEPEAEVVEESTTEAEAPTEDAPPASEPEPTEDKPRVDPEQFKGYLDEREKRQQLERELAELRKQQKPAEKIDPLENPQGFQAQVDEQIRKATFATELRLMAKMHPDWNEANAWINEQIGTNAAVQAKLSGSEDILEDAYQMFQDHKKLEQFNGVEGMQSTIDSLQAELAALKGDKDTAEKSEQEQTKAKATGKPSLAATGNSSGSVSAEGHQTLEDFLGRDFNHR